MTQNRAMVKIMLDLQEELDLIKRNYKTLQSEHNLLKKYYTNIISEKTDYKATISELKKQLKAARWIALE